MNGTLEELGYKRSSFGKTGRICNSSCELTVWRGKGKNVVMVYSRVSPHLELAVQEGEET